MRLAVVATSFSLIVACSSKEPAPAAPPPVAAKPAAAAAPPSAPAAAAPAPGWLSLAPGTLTVTRGGASKEFALAATGEVTADGVVVGKVAADGTATAATGRRLATLAPDGTVTIAGEAETFTVAADGTASRAGKSLVTIGADGVLGGAAIDEATPGTTIAFSGDPAARRALIFAWLVQ